ncbi:MAG: UDP-N-acetylmuramoyl-tripeptide--D-alanyl-D-alanine ligase [Candidatus Omnitrophica bacterium]|nr:UDP-N-acetylmuramoyl-tripeptide--D-alanyl-D-alanine ligase [Candidatus Omnitrophota bacterium]
MINTVNILEKIIKPEKIINRSFFKRVDFCSIDSRTIKKGYAFIAFKGRDKDGHDYINQAVQNGASLIICEKVPQLSKKVTVVVVKDSIVALKKIAEFILSQKKPFVYAVTGSVGKTTTKEMLGFLLRGKYSVWNNLNTENNIFGLVKTVFSYNKEKILVMELGTNAPGEIKELSSILKPDVGVITFVKPVHLYGLKNLDGVFKEKTALLESNPKIKAVLNLDDPYLSKVDSCRNVYWFGKTLTSKQKGVYGKLVKTDSRESIFTVNGKYKMCLKTNFPAFFYNALAAICAAYLKGVSVKDSTGMLSGFSFPSMRMQEIKTSNFTFINDAYNANPYSFKETLKVMSSYRQKKIAVVGDMLELGEKASLYHSRLAPEIIKANFEYCLAIGENMKYLVFQLHNKGYKKAYHFNNLSDIVSFIAKNKKNEELIFLKGSRSMGLDKIIDML